MKKALLFAMIIFISQVISAQSFSGGMRTGVSMWIDNTNYGEIELTNAKEKRITWDKGIFLRYDAKKKFALEVSTGHYYVYSDLSGETSRDIIDLSLIYYKNDHYTNAYETEINFMYAIEPVLCKTIEHNIGIGISLIYAHTRYDRIYEGGYPEIPLTHKTGTYNEYFFMTGLNYMLKYNLNKKFHLTSKASVSVNPFTVLDSSPGLIGRLGLHLVAGYNF